MKTNNSKSPSDKQREMMHLFRFLGFIIRAIVKAIRKRKAAKESQL